MVQAGGEVTLAEMGRREVLLMVKDSRKQMKAAQHTK
jgi:hypothetical protein